MQDPYSAREHHVNDRFICRRKGPRVRVGDCIDNYSGAAEHDILAEGHY